MTVEYRPLRADEMSRFYYADRIGFGNSTAESEMERAPALWPLDPAWTLAALDDGEIATQIAWIPLSMRWNWRDIRCGGVTSVSTSPTHRRRGHLRRLMGMAFSHMRDQRVPVAALWASMGAIYQRFGYAPSHDRLTTDIDPRTVRFVNALDTPGRLRMIKVGEARAAIEDVYRRFAAPRTGMIDRSAPFPDGRTLWEVGTFVDWPPDGPPLLVATYEEEGVVLGYVLYGVARKEQPRPGPEMQLTVRDLVWRTPAAHRALAQLLFGHDLAYSVRFMRMPVDDPLLLHVQEPRLLNATLYDGTYVRIVDLVPALEGRGYGADGTFTFAFADEMCPWNAGLWRLEVEGGGGRVTAATGEPELALGPRALTMLACGYQDATTLAHAGLITAHESRALAIADDLFRTAHAPACYDFF